MLTYDPEVLDALARLGRYWVMPSSLCRRKATTDTGIAGALRLPVGPSPHMSFKIADFPARVDARGPPIRGGARVRCASGRTLHGCEEALEG